MPNSSNNVENEPNPGTQAEEPAVVEPEADDGAATILPDGLCPVVGIGASAGGLEAFTQMLKHLPPTTGMAYVLVQHLDPHHESMLVDLLASHTSMPVKQAIQSTKVEPNHVYIIPPNAEMAIRRGVLELSPRGGDRTRHLPIDHFLSSLARDQRSRSIGVILSGAASDGTLGLEEIKGAGGITFAQDETARFDGMPRNAIAAGVVDFVLPPDAMAREIADIAEHSYFGVHNGAPLAEKGLVLDKILNLLQARTGVNFTYYKKPTISRRVLRRMAVQHIENQEEYLKLLEQRAAEVDALFGDLLITVTEFFRDQETFEALTEKAFPAFLNDHRDDDSAIRIWVPGCSTGKEVYSLAIALIEYLGKKQRSIPIQIFGTDVSDRSIETARIGKYPETISATVSPERLGRFFQKVEGGYQITRSVRDLCIFSRQDLTKDPPLSKMDLISCRNLLIYLGPVLQRRVMSIFLYALQPSGCLLLGNSESLGPLADHFVAIDGKHRIYKRNLELPRPHFDLPSGIPLPDRSPTAGASMKITEATIVDRRVDQMLLDEYAPSGFLIDNQEQVVKFRGNVGRYLSPPAGDPELDVFRLVREDIALALRPALDEARKTDSIVRKERIRLRVNDAVQDVNLIVRPVVDPVSERHFLILFEEPIERVSRTSSAKSSPIETRNQDYRDLALELSSTRSYMQRLVEELRSANEEAQSTNEELQSTNEELQTAKEELQSSNEELTTTNEEMQGRNSELNQLNDDLVNLLSSMQMPIVMLNGDLCIRRYTPMAEKVLRLIPADIGRPISDLKPRINVPDLEELLSRVISSIEPIEREVRHEQGRWYSLRIQPYKTAKGRVEGAVLQLLDIDQLKLSMKEAVQAKDYAEAIIETVQEPLLVLNQELCIQTANRAFFETFQTSPEMVMGKSIYGLGNGHWRLPEVSQLFESLLRDENTVVNDAEVEQQFEGLGWGTLQLNARHLNRSQEGLILLAIEDVSDRKRAAEAKYRRLFEAAKDGILIINAETGEITDINPSLAELLGISREDLIGKPFWKVQALEELHEGRGLLLENLKTDKVLRVPEVTLKTRKGQREIVVEVVANLYQDGLKSVAQFNIRDITERVQFDRQFQQTARLESLGILAGGIAHDFNNLLAGILGNAGLALGDAPPGTPYQSALKDVIHASQRAADLTRQMLAYAGKGRLNVRPVDLAALVREISSLVQSSISKSVELELDLPASLPLVEADASQLQQVVMNLVINGAEAIGEGRKGRVQVSASVEDLDADLLRQRHSSSELTPGRFVVFEVADNGGGMDAETQSHIFDPFFTTKFTGRGLGLAAVQGIIRGHHGTIRVSSTQGRGSVFQILLPALQSQTVVAAPKPGFEDLSGTGLILVIDDEQIVLKTTHAILERNGYQVLTAANGELGVEAVREHKDELALVLLDLTMPVMGGEEAFARIKAIAPRLPVILSSGYDASQALALFGEKALAGFLNKPSTVGDLLETVKSALVSNP